MLTVKEIDATRARQRHDLLRIDVRDHDELVGALPKLDDALHVHLPLIFSDGLPEHIAPDTPLLMICRSGARSGRASQHLLQKGYTNVHNLVGGMMGWYGDRNVSGVQPAQGQPIPSERALVACAESGVAP